MTEANPTINLDRPHGLIDGARLAAIVVRSGENVTYLSGVVYPALR